LYNGNDTVVQKTFREWAEWYIDEISKELSDSHITRTVNINFQAKENSEQ